MATFWCWYTIIVPIVSLVLGFVVARWLVRPKCAGILYLCKHENGDPIDMYTELTYPPDAMLKDEFVYFMVHVTDVKSQK